MIVSGSLVPFAIAASATVNPFFSAHMMLIRTVLSPFLVWVCFWRHIKTTHGLIHIDKGSMFLAFHGAITDFQK